MRRALRSLALAVLAVAGFATIAEAQAPPVFDASHYKGLDLDRAARDQYGAGARAVSTSGHLYGWRAQVGGQLLSLDLARAVSRQYGPGYTLVAVDAGAAGWKAVDLKALPPMVLPVMAVASDVFGSPAAVGAGLKRFSSVLVALGDWYRRRAGKGYRMLQPIVLASAKSSAEWDALSTISTDPKHRYDILYEAKGLFEARAGPRPASLRIAMSVLAGDTPDGWLGAASTDGFAFAPAHATTVLCATGALTGRCANVAYALGHELGHAFGLGHSCDIAKPPACDSSIMQSREPEAAVLLPAEVRTLLASGFFR